MAVILGDVAAGQTAVTLFEAQAASPVTATTSVPSVALTLRLRNTSAGEVRLLPDRQFQRVGDRLASPATWRRTTDAGVAGASPIALQPGDEAMLVLSGELTLPGVYETGIDVLRVEEGKERFDSRIAVAVTRSVPPIPADLITEAKPFRLAWSDAGKATRLAFQLRNSTPEAVEFRPPEVAAFTREADGGDVALLRPALPGIDPQRCGTALDPGALCEMAAVIPAGLSPGLYALDIAVTGSGGGLSERTMAVQVKAGCFWAFLAVLIGAAGGLLVTTWRSGGRQMLAALSRVASLRLRAAELSRLVAAGELAPAAARLAVLVDDVETRIRAGEDGAERLAALEDRLRLLRLAEAIDRGFAHLPTGGDRPLRPILAERRRALIDKLDSDTIVAAEVDPLAHALAADMQAVSAFTTAYAEAAALANALAALKARAAAVQPPAGLDDALQALRSELAAAAQPLPAEPGADTIAERREHLTAKAAELSAAAKPWTQDIAAHLGQRLQQGAAAGGPTAVAFQALGKRLAAALPTETPASLQILAEIWKTADGLAPAAKAGAEEGVVAEADAGAPAAPTIPTLPAVALQLDFLPALLMPAFGASQGTLESRRLALEWGTNAFVLVLIGLGGVWTLWIGNPAWGTPGDIIAALLAGAATRFVVGDAVKPAVT